MTNKNIHYIIYKCKANLQICPNDLEANSFSWTNPDLLSGLITKNHTLAYIESRLHCIIKTDVCWKKNNNSPRALTKERPTISASAAYMSTFWEHICRCDTKTDVNMRES